jgi:threonine aldolase
MDALAHPFNYEGGGPAAVSGALIRTVQGLKGVFTADQVTAAVRGKSYGQSRTRVVSVEQPTNIAGGVVWPVDAITAVCRRARDHRLVTHLDGARLFNAEVASGVAAAVFAEPFDSAWIDLSKGLGCPVGAVLAGSSDFIENAWYVKHRLGGAMRQAGIIAAAGIYALEHNVDRLAEDHANARRLAEGLGNIPGITIDAASVETNTVFFQAAGAEQLARRLGEAGVSVGVYGPSILRAVTHLDIDRQAVDSAIQIIATVMKG